MPPPLDPAREERELPDRTRDGPQLVDMDYEGRQQFYKDLFSRNVEPLAHIAPPDECSLHPQFKDEILAAYFRYTTFTVKVWVNYDTATKKFYIDRRAQDCGKVRLTKKDIAHLEKLDQTNELLELSRIRLEIGTPFSDFCKVTLRASPSKLDVGYDVTLRIAWFDQDDPELIDFIQDMYVECDGELLPYDQKGFQMQDVEELASRCLRKPTADELCQKRFSSDLDDSLWMDIANDEEENPGWVDFDALGKSCRMLCGSCRPFKPRSFW